MQREGVQRRRRRGGVGAGRRRRRGRGSAQAQEGTRFLEERLGGELALDVCLQVPNVPVLGAQREVAGDPPGSARDQNMPREGRASVLTEASLPQVHLALAPHHPGAVPCGQAGPGCGRDPRWVRGTGQGCGPDVAGKGG